jgi:hypothetical protein
MSALARDLEMMNVNRRRLTLLKNLAICAAVALLSCSLFSTAETATPLVPDGSFESGEGHPAGWLPNDTAGDGLTCTWTEGNAHRGARAIEAQSKKARPAWRSVAIPVSPGNSYIAGGWIRAEHGAGSLEVMFLDREGRILLRRVSPRIENCGEWRYVATDAMAPDQAATAEVAFWAKGGAAALDDAAFDRAPSTTPMNADFEMPLDSKGRIPFWNEEEDKTLSQGQRGGKYAFCADQPAHGAACLRLTADDDWFAFSSINYPVWDWNRHVALSVMMRADDGAEVRLGLTWTDSAQKPIRTDIVPAAKGASWHAVTAGPFQRPSGARGIRPVLLIAKGESNAGGEATAWFDDVALRIQDDRYLEVVANQVGYDATGPKTAVVLSNFFPVKAASGKFEMRNGQNRIVCEGEMKCAGRMRGEKTADWGWYFWRADFSSLNASGEFRVKVRLGSLTATSHPFRVGPDTLFRETAAANVDFFYVQRCGIEVPGWHAACHLDDAKLPGGTHRDLTGGWHSAGDYNKLNWEYGDGGVVYALISAYEAAPECFDGSDRDRDGLCDLLDEAWWGAKFLAKVQIPETGGILNHIEQGPDRKTWMNWCPPEKTTDNVIGTPDDPIVTKGEGNSPLAIGAWARLSRILSDRGIQNSNSARVLRD